MPDNPDSITNLSKHSHLKRKTLHFSLIIFVVCVLFTVLAWNHYFNSNQPYDRNFVSNLVLAMGLLFSIASGLFAWSLESGREFLLQEVERRTQLLIEKEKVAAEAQARASEEHAKHKDSKETLRKLEEAQNELLQSEKLATIGRVVAGVVHELNNPIITLTGYARLLLESGIEGETRDHVQIIKKQGERCHQIVQELLLTTRRKRRVLDRSDICKLIDDAIAALPLEFKSSGIEIERKYPEDRPRVETDPPQMHQVFLNVLVNAWHALEESPAPRKIFINVLVNKSTVQVMFTDTGCGIPKDNMNKIFEPFFTTKPAGKGSGLGLGVSYAIIREHGGRIALQSQEGKGTIFVIEMPLLNKIRKIDQPEKEVTQQQSTFGKKILVVDDEPMLVDFVARLLDAWGYGALTARSGREALDVASAESENICLAVMDIHMPRMTGIETAREFKKEKNLSQIPIIFLTGLPGDPLASEISGTYTCLKKPFQYEELRAAIWNLTGPTAAK